MVYLLSASAGYEERKLPQTLGPNMVITIEGAIHWWSGKRFFVDLQEGKDDGPQGDIGFHMSVRYDLDRDSEMQENQEIVFNTWTKDGGWGKEEKYYPVPRGHGTPAKWYLIKIIPRDDYYDVYLENKEYLYKHRMPKEKLKYLVVGGDFEIESIKFE